MGTCSDEPNWPNYPFVPQEYGWHLANGSLPFCGAVYKWNIYMNGPGAVYVLLL